MEDLQYKNIYTISLLHHNNNYIYDIMYIIYNSIIKILQRTVCPINQFAK